MFVFNSSKLNQRSFPRIHLADFLPGMGEFPRDLTIHMPVVVTEECVAHVDASELLTQCLPSVVVCCRKTRRSSERDIVGMSFLCRSSLRPSIVGKVSTRVE